jgi:hypothetical protein
MNKRLVSLVLVVAMAAASVSAFAADKAKKDDGKKTTQTAKKAESSTVPWAASYYKAGQLDAYAGVGYGYLGIGGSVDAEYIIGAFNVGGVPLQYGARVNAWVGFDSYGLEWCVDPQATLHLGTKFGGFKLDWYIAIGASIGSNPYYSYWYDRADLGFWFSESDGVTWFFSDKAALTIDYTYAYVSRESIGVTFKF